MCMKKEKQRAESDSPPQPESQESPQLLFINKDANNLNRTPEEGYAIGSHVSRGSRKWKRLKSYLDLDKSTSRILSGTDSEKQDSPRALKASTSSSSSGKALKLRWRMFDGKVTSTKTVGAKDFAKVASASSSGSASASTSAQRPTAAGALSSESSSPATPASLPALTMPSPFPSSDEDHVKTIHDLLGIYFQRFRPAVFAISRSWIWIEDSVFVLSSPSLTYAICAFTSAFIVGSQQGLDKLCIPPENQSISQSMNPTSADHLWAMPQWFLFQAQAVSLLRRRLSLPSDPTRPIPKAELHAILFLMRLHILLGNQDAAHMHMSAISSATENAAILPDLRIDVAMWKTNFVLALKYPSATRTRTYLPAAIHTQQEPLLETDVRAITDMNDRRNTYRLLMDRTVVWTCTSPTPLSVPFASETLIQDHMTIDAEGYTILQPPDTQQLRACLLIARYLFAYLRYIDADTTLGCIRKLIPDLQSRLSPLFETPRIGLDVLWRRLPRVLAYLLFAGAFASRGVESDKIWFIRHISRGFEMRVLKRFEDVTGTLQMFLELETIREVLLVDVWNDVMREASGEVGGSGTGGSAVSW